MQRETRIEELKRYACFGGRDAQLLLAFRSAAAPAIALIAQEFCERIREHATAFEITVDESQIGLLAASLNLWMVGVCGGVYDEEYYEQTERAGRAQLRIGLPQRHLLTGMARIRVSLLRLVDTQLKEWAAPTRDALNRILDIDLAIMLEAYRVTEARARDAEKLSALGNLAAGLAHEIRNPLNGAQLHLVILERAIEAKGAEQDTLQAARVVSAQIKRVASMLTEFLEFARPLPLLLQPMSLFELFQQVIELTTARAEAAGVTVLRELPTGDVEFHADYDKLTQVLLNLVQNAIDAADSSGGSVVVRGRVDGRCVLIEVERDGPGSPNPPAPILDGFHSTKQGAAGLGLATAQRIVTEHRGTLEASRESGKSTFLLTLPLEATTKN